MHSRSAPLGSDCKDEAVSPAGAPGWTGDPGSWHKRHLFSEAIDSEILSPSFIKKLLIKIQGC